MERTFNVYQAILKSVILLHPEVLTTNVTSNVTRTMNEIKEQYCGSLVTMGWPSLMAYVTLSQLMFLWKMLLLPSTNIYKSITISIIMSIVSGFSDNISGPMNNIIQKCRKYKLINVVVNSIKGGEYISMAEWKKFVKKEVFDYDVKRLKVACSLNKSLCFMNKDIKINVISPLWMHCYKNVHDYKMVRKCIQLLIGSFRQIKGMCNLCGEVEFTLDHLLFSCINSNDTRDRLWKEVCNVSPQGLVSDINKMSDIDKCKLILNGFNSLYNTEWYEIYASVIKFVYVITKEAQIV